MTAPKQPTPPPYPPVIRKRFTRKVRGQTLSYVLTFYFVKVERGRPIYVTVPESES